MSEPEAASAQADLEALKALRADASELEHMESLLDRFNVFETIGFTHWETMHSRILAFLLDPSQSHGLGDIFLKYFLQGASESFGRVSLAFTFDRMGKGNLSQTSVQREVPTGDGRIDILLVDEDNRWALIIENKIRTTEHDDQLNRYFRFVKDKHPGWYVLGVYLTPRGDLPSREEDKERYLPLSYAAVCEIISAALADSDLTVRPEIRMTLDHYAQMVRRHIVGDDFEIAKLCSRAYRKHQRAIDLITQRRFAHQEAVYKVIEGLVEGSPNLILDNRESYLRPGEYAGEDYLAFFPKGWDVPALKVAANGFSASGLILVFWFSNMPDTLDLYLELAPGNEEARERLLSMAHQNPGIFGEAPESLSEYTPFFTRPFLKTEFYREATYSECEEEICNQWDEFLDKDLPRIVAAIRKESWVWKTTRTTEGR